MKHLHLLLLFILISSFVFASKSQPEMHKVLSNQTNLSNFCIVTVTVVNSADYFCENTQTNIHVSCTTTKTAEEVSCSQASAEATKAADLENQGSIASSLVAAMVECENTPPVE